MIQDRETLAQRNAAALGWCCTAVRKNQALRNKHREHLFVYVPGKELGCAG